jgi:hypothetical protein
MNERRSPLSAGFASISHAKLVLLLALTSALLGFTGASPLMPALKEAAAGTLAGDHFLRNNPTFAPTDFFDFVREDSAAFGGMHHSAMWVSLLGVLLQMFFAGGIVIVLGRGPFSFDQFFAPARRNLWHNVKCFLIFAFLNLLVLGLWFSGTSALLKKVQEGVAPDAASRSAATWIVSLVGLLLFAVLSLLYDFARAARRHSPTIGAWRAYRFARRALSGSWISAFGLWLFWLIAGGIAVAALFAVTWSMPSVSGPAIALLFALQFLVLWVRSAVRVAAWGSYVAFLEPRARPALSATARVTYRVADPAPAV